MFALAAFAGARSEFGLISGILKFAFVFTKGVAFAAAAAFAALFSGVPIMSRFQRGGALRAFRATTRAMTVKSA